MVTIEKQDGVVTIQLPERFFSDELQQMLKQIQVQETVSRGEVTQEDIDELSREVNRAMFLRLRERFRGIEGLEELFADESEEE